MAEGPGAFEARFGLLVIPGYLEFDEALDHLPGSPEWPTYLFVHDDDHALIGLGGFKGPPHDGAVEIGYGVAPAYRGRGFATAAANEMVEHARASGVRLVIAHTLPEHNASTAVLERARFRRTVVVDHADDGPVWRWERALENQRPRAS